ncbi:aminoglycoside adenylyltransferase domain-containing protein [Paenibacillus sp. CAU 1782]
MTWNQCPAEVRRQASLLTVYMEDFLGNALTGVYLHGSACLDAFRPGRSDLDLLIVVERPLSAQERFQLMCAFLSLHRQPAPVEASILLRSDLAAWRHPAPYQFHFSEHWRKRYEAIEAWEDYSFWDFKEEQLDPDLACHTELARERGIALLGPSPQFVLPPVPDIHVTDSLRNDARDFIRTGHEAMAALTLARVWSYCELSVFLSKAEAAKWAIKQLAGTPDSRTLKAALAVFEEETVLFDVEREVFLVFVDNMLCRIDSRNSAAEATVTIPVNV